MKIFLSYASEDQSLAEQVQLALLAAGHDVFFDQESLPPSGDYHSRIRQSVERSDLMVFLVTPQSVAQGSYALTELRYARDKWPHPKGKVLPVMARETPWDAIPEYLKAVTVLVPEGNTAAAVLRALAAAGRPRGQTDQEVFDSSTSRGDGESDQDRQDSDSRKTKVERDADPIKNQKRSLLNPANLVQRALAAVPQLRWVLAAAAALILFSVGASFYQTGAGAFVAGLAIFFLAGLAAVLFLAIRREEQRRERASARPGDVLLWVITLVVSACFVLTLTSVAFKWPRPFPEIVDALTGVGVTPPGPSDITFTEDKNVSWEALPERFRQRPTGAPSSKTLKERGSITLNNSTLFLPATADRLRVSLVFDRLNLLNKGNVVTNGNNLTLSGNQIVSEGGEIVSFPNDQLRVGAPVVSGIDGGNGKSGGNLVLENLSTLKGSLAIRLPGQDGANGTKGWDGIDGVNGTRGDNAASGVVDCRRGAGNGHPGQPGQPGQRGGNGGNGGDGGRLILVGSHIDPAPVEFVAPGGKGGTGAPGGKGGKGGKGGDGGSPVGLCSGGGARGADGSDGPRGDNGKDGMNGKPGARQLEGGK